MSPARPPEPHRGTLNARRYRGRFAPSPTGALHLGLARTALLGWLRARSQGGTFVLRIEDLDGPRVVPGATERLLEDLRFLGLDWDEGPDVGGPLGPYVQSQRGAHYAQALARLAERGLLYGCSCTRKELAIASAPHGPSEFGPPYPGTCRTGPQRMGAACSLRLRVPEPLPSFQDARLGEVAPVAQGDFVVQRSDGTVSYQLAVVVDDIAMEVTEVLRGDDLAGCTGWQLALYDALEAPRPTFVHVPLLRGADGRRLAKRDGARAVAALRAQGIEAPRIVGALAASLGLAPLGSSVRPTELVPAFALEQLVERTIDWERELGLKSAR